MKNVQSDEGLRLWIISHLSEKLGNHAILKGGMVLRLLDCPRYTNDLDYVFVPFRSKKEIVPLLDKAFEGLDGVQIKKGLHSTSVRYDIAMTNAFGTFRTQVEANVSESCESEPISTGDVASQHQQLPRVVRVMRFDVALAHKLAAWNERGLVRDLYDAYFIHKHLNQIPHIPTLAKRLEKINYAKSLKGPSLPRHMTLEEFLAHLEKGVFALTDNNIREELRDSLEPTQLAGLSLKIRVGLSQMVEKIRVGAP